MKLVLATDRINWVGFYTFYMKEVRRFFKVANQTIVAPVVSSLLFLAIFHLSAGAHIKEIESVSYPIFVGAGLVIYYDSDPECFR